jgi:Anti-sigma-K factor rskA
MIEYSTLTCDEFLDLAAGVALDAVEPHEYELIEAHAAKCQDCENHLRQFREVAAVLGSAVPQHEPPAALRTHLLEAARRIPRQDAAPGRRLKLPLRWPRRPRVSPAWLVAAASLCMSLVALGSVATLQRQIGVLQADAQVAREHAARYDHVVEVLASDKLAIRPLEPVVQNMPSRGMVYMDPSSGTGMLMCHNLPPLEQGHAYQVWFVRGNEKVSGGLLWPDHYGNGYTLIQVPTDLQSFDSVGITDEPGTGSQWPTTPRVIGTPIKESDQ